MAKNKNKQGREKRKKRIKHPNLGRAKAAIRNVHSNKKPKKPEKCPSCDVIYKNIKILHGEMIKHICNCNEYLVEKAMDRLRKKQAERAKKNHPSTVKVIEFNI